MDNQPLANPIPSLNLGYDVKDIKPKRIVKHAPPYPTLSKKQKLDMKEQATQNETELIPDAVVEHFCVALSLVCQSVQGVFQDEFDCING